MTAAAPTPDSRPVLTFDAEAHVYQIDGRTVPSVTTILSAVFGDLLWPFRSEFAMDRGTKVHRAVHLYVQHDLDVNSLSPYVAGYVAAAVRFLVESGFCVAASEQRLHSAIHDYCGTLDIVGTLNGRLTVADWKSGTPGDGARMQTAAYANAWAEMTGQHVRQRCAVQLNDDGSYAVSTYADMKNDMADFVAALRVYRRREELAR